MKNFLSIFIPKKYKLDLIEQAHADVYKLYKKKLITNNYYQRIIQHIDRAIDNTSKRSDKGE